jgi:PAS domain S-box-containing protein
MSVRDPGSASPHGQPLLRAGGMLLVAAGLAVAPLLRIPWFTSVAAGAGAALLGLLAVRVLGGQRADGGTGAGADGADGAQAPAASCTRARRGAAGTARTSRSRITEFYHRTPALLLVTDAQGRLVDASDAWLDSLGWTRAEVVGRPLTGFMAAESRALAEREFLPLLASRGVVRGVPCRFQNRAGDLVDIRFSAVTLQDGHALAVLINDSDRKRTETALRRSQEQLLHAQKMDAVGRLAGGMAHDFNNLLTAIIGYAELLQNQLADRPPLAANAGSVLKAAQRAAALTRHLLAVSRKQVLDPAVLDLRAVVADQEAVLRRLVGEQVALVVAIPPDIGRIHADAGQIGQVLMNLAVNARDAMPEGGRLTISAVNRELDPTLTPVPGGPAPGDYVQLAVGDTGTGMDSEVRAHLFEPFYTTKAAGKGTGLGLSIVYGIVTQSGGHLQVASAPGKGTTFTMLFPRTHERAPAPPAGTPARGVAIGGATILLAEDEPEIRALVRELLLEHGYRVLAAVDGADALRLHAEHRAGGQPAVDLLLSDVVMPRMGGRELAHALRQQVPGLRVVLMSGFTGASDDLERGNGPDQAFIAKPFNHAQLLKVVRGMLQPITALNASSAPT